jgi:hypothetical protein
MQGIAGAFGDMGKIMSVVMGAQMQAAEAAGLSMEEVAALTAKGKAVAAGAAASFSADEKVKLAKFGAAFAQAFEAVKGELGPMGEQMAGQIKKGIEELVTKIGA